ncbi:threonine--tRNA ligase [Candidatus Parcubacteria bacterium]|nr:MAG: threonine--tRNA ligase [Candidatus Parcubacteria bacterium]
MKNEESSSARMEKIRHSLAHLMAAVIKDKHPKVKLGIGPVIENGFYYDFDFSALDHSPTEEKLPKLENFIRELIKQDLKFERQEIPAEKAREIFKDEPFKLELVEELAAAGEKISVYKSGGFIDLCAGPHVESAKEINPDAFKLTKVAGAYWKGSEKNKMLTRIYGVAFETKEELGAYLRMLEEAEKRDHRKLGKELELFVFSDLVGPGLPLYTPKGAIIRREIQNYSNELRKKIGYQEVHTPQINKAELFKISGHYDKYKENLFKVSSNYTEEEYYLKPMNCPQHTQIFSSQMRSYKELPIRIADFANLYRDEKPGELSGLTRLRAFSQDDGHCFCREDQIEEEFSAILNLINEAMRVYNMSYSIRLSLRDEQNKQNYLGSEEVWQKSQNMMEKLLKEKNIDYIRGEGEAAFYGPKMDLIAKDCLGRNWQLSTIQLDFNMPVRFGLEYIGEDGKKHTPVMIHSALVGSAERFMATLIEHTAGNFPVWISPIQALIIPVGEKYNDYGEKMLSELKSAGIRVEIDKTSETLGKRIRSGKTQKIPYLLVVGEKEKEAGTVAVNFRDKKEQETMAIAQFVELIQKEIREKK